MKKPLPALDWASPERSDGWNKSGPSRVYNGAEESHDYPSARLALRRPRAAEESGLHLGCGADPSPRHRREHRHLQRGQHCFAEAPAVSEPRRPGEDLDALHEYWAAQRSELVLAARASRRPATKPQLFRYLCDQPGNV